MTISKQDQLDALRSQMMALAGQYADLAYAPAPFVPGVSPVPVSGKVVGAPELQNLIDSSLDLWLTTGRFNDQFEKRLADFMGVRFALTVNSGSSANLTATSALCSPMLGARALKPGDEVITCATGFPTTVNPALQNGLVPVFVDVDLPTYNIKPDLIEAAVTEKTKAIIIAHTLGNPFDLGEVMRVAEKHNLWVIEDSCDALGAKYDDKLVGTFGDIGTVSFYPAHHITMGEGGAVWTDRGDLKRLLESVRDWGRDCYCPPGQDNTCNKRFKWKLGDLPRGYDHKYTYSNIGYNLKITDMQAAVGLAQFDRLEGFIAARNRNFGVLKGLLSDMQDHLILPEATPRSEPSWFGFPITLRSDEEGIRDDLVQHLNAAGVATRLLFGGNLIRQPYMKGRNWRVFGDLTNSDKVMTSTFWIGLYPGLTDDHLTYACETIAKFFRERSRT
ncbi:MULTISPECIES: lipopolysaccharide biosynthesis protein RfbH [unclassified Caulobacter]|uniref:lipopolysaccharide biosynthesis protein RfbH n=1 Tax=unclassified Caulobacter TaxID=2648921 RepID=UPI000D3A67EC|nr:MULTISPECIES: lipopolysaccharide biosynthesis protein RfbH [unclassified Caulobacter]PTS87720.1 lipopolysaccharide biosynthesis protein RfbH [Caulobacter sp. HMWF009]PTT12513.1 lipopolysaccharide biosynthesis protein RfbH [Caulobacter sp. HMWF025]PTT77552.1 lipopolysaccharide biosynthesis protein RfbH [Pseudomonas sp. HMWF010]